MLKLSKYPPKGFTLIELLVVVLIIGILAAITMPQYKIAVAKSKYATLKNTTKALREASERYYLVHNTLPTKFDDLDISFAINREIVESDYFSLKFNDGMVCDVYNSSRLVYCYRNILGKSMYYMLVNNNTHCYSGSNNTSDVNNKVCQQETGKTAEDCSLSSNTCIYSYD